MATGDPSDLAEEIRRERVGGSYWAARPELHSRYILARSTRAVLAARALDPTGEMLLWTETPILESPSDARVIVGECDPWHMVEFADAVVLEPDDEFRIVARLSGVPVYVSGSGSHEAIRDEVAIADLLARAMPAEGFENPFTGQVMTAAEAIELCGFWRRLIDSNRGLAGGVGFAFWKQDHVAPLLWSGSGPFQFLRAAPEVDTESPVAIWRAKTAPQVIRELERAGTPLVEVEDGFLRSRGLGADCIPPLSITVDRRGAHFDPAAPSELEDLLQTGGFDARLVARACELRRLIVAASLGKYEQGGSVIARPAGERRHILVPGQVEDDRAVHLGGCGLVSNLELLKRVREQAPDAFILYKPHPDVLAGHRRGAIPDRLCLQHADSIVGELSIGSLIAMVDEVHVNTSLAGFEALMRDKRVTTHGVPFYAGWGLTCDLGPVPARRTARRTVDELVAATLLLYPRYLDPITGLPCPPEVLVARLSGSGGPDAGLLVSMRRLQGRLKRRLRSLVQ